MRCVLWARSWIRKRWYPLVTLTFLRRPPGDTGLPDTVIVGSGAAGLLLAARLTEANASLSLTARPQPVSPVAALSIRH